MTQGFVQQLPIPLPLSKGGTGAVLLNSVITKVNVQVFSSSGTYTPSAGMKYCIVEVQAAGGGGGGVVGTGGGQNCISAPGGGGAYSRGIYSAATIGSSQTVVVGTGGTAGASTGGNGGSGGNSSFGTLIVCTGGQGGVGNASASGGFINPNGASAGGTATTSGNIIAISGQYGMCGYGTGGSGVSGMGGASFFGKGGSTVGGPGASAFASSSVPNAINACSYGGGGGGAISFQAAGASLGGVGSDGIVIVTEFISV